MIIQANGISINYIDEGDGDAIVMIHGAFGDANMWRNQIPFFSKNYRVIAYDSRGSGKSENPRGEEFSVPVMVRDAYHLIMALGLQKAFILGHSLGGRIALELALNHPEVIKALVLANSCSGLGEPSPEIIERWQADLEMLERGELDNFARMIKEGSFPPDMTLESERESQEIMESELQNKADSFIRLLRSMSTPGTPPDLSRLKCPVLIVEGMDDRLVESARLREVHQAITGSKLVILPSGHSPALEAPAEFNSAVLEFLASLK